MPHNRTVFDELVVVTSPDDKATQAVCDHYFVRCLVTDAMFRGGQVFNKGAAIEEGLRALDAPDYVCVYDSDIAFPPRAGELLRDAHLDEQCLYGVDRLMVPSFEAWASFLTRPVRQHYQGSAWPVPFPVGYRVTHAGRGYLPIGFFQLFNVHSAYLGTPWYPTEFDTAAESDLRFALKYPRGNRHVLPDFFVYHLESEADPAAVGTNWSGRKTKAFGPGG